MPQPQPQPRPTQTPTQTPNMNKSKQRTAPSYKAMVAVLVLMCGCGNAQSIQGTRTSMLMEIDGAALMLTSTGQSGGSGYPVTVASLADVHNATETMIALMQPQVGYIISFEDETFCSLCDPVTTAELIMLSL